MSSILADWRQEEERTPEKARNAANLDSKSPTVEWFLRSCVRAGDSVHDAFIESMPFRIGRVSGNDLQIPNPTVSGSHAEITMNGPDILVHDLDSTNGTFVNGNRVTDKAPLHQGDLLQLGTVKMHFLKREEATYSATVSADVAGHALAHFQFDKLLAQPAVCPHFQPIVRFSDESIVGYEILGRSRLLGLESPDKMFRVAEERSQECHLSRVLRDEGIRLGRHLDARQSLYVNTHPEELQNAELFESLKSLREEHPTPSIVLEVHESAVTSSQRLGELRKRLNDLQIGLAYDDFGAGQARLIELCDVPPDVIKFDLKFVQGLGEASQERRQLVGALVQMVRDLGIIPLAEGVERETEAVICNELGFELAQGYYFGRPAPLSRWMTDASI